MEAPKPGVSQEGFPELVMVFLMGQQFSFLLFIPYFCPFDKSISILSCHPAPSQAQGQPSKTRHV